MQWKRPESVPIGQVWYRFKGKERDGEPAPMFQVRDLEESFRKQCLDMMQETFIRDEPLCKILNINTDPESINTIRANWEGFLDQGMSLACFTEVGGQPDELVGFNNIIVKSRGDEEEDLESIKGESWKKLLKTLIAAEEMADVFQYYGVDEYLSSSGLTVLPKFRGQNIGARIVEARELLAQAVGIQAGATVFTAIPSQVLAAKCGYEVIAELPYSKMVEQGVDLSGCECKSAKLMGKRFKKE